jgi:hypothetical protein
MGDWTQHKSLELLRSFAFFHAPALKQAWGCNSPDYLPAVGDPLMGDWTQHKSLELLRSSAFFHAPALKQAWGCNSPDYLPAVGDPLMGDWTQPQSLELLRSSAFFHAPALKQAWRKGMKKALAFAKAFGLRRERDSNPRYLAVQWFSRPPHSTTLPSLLIYKEHDSPFIRFNIIRLCEQDNAFQTPAFCL